MRDHETGHITAECVQGIADRSLCLRVETACCLVEDQKLRRAQKRAGDGESLPLPTGQIRAVFVERRFIAQRQLLDEVRRPAEAADAAELVVGYAVQTQRQIVPDGIGEQAGVLPDIGDVPPERGKRKLRQRLAACQNRAVFRLIEPQQQPRSGGTSPKRG